LKQPFLLPRSVVFICQNIQLCLQSTFYSFNTVSGKIYNNEKAE